MTKGSVAVRGKSAQKTQTMKSVNELKNIRGKRVLVRVDFNVPVVHGEIEDDTRIRTTVLTIEWLAQKGAKVILMSHFGRPILSRHPERSEGSRSRRELRDSSASGLRMTIFRLGELLKKKVQMADKWDWVEIGQMIKAMKGGQVLMLPNLRLQTGEEKNSKPFAQGLAGLADFYVNEAFSVCHRKHASVVGVPKFLPSYAGFTLIKEVDTLGSILKAPKKPFIVLMGGAKITDKIAMMQIMTRKAEAVLVGGILALHFFKAMGYGVGGSRIEAEGVRLAKKLVGNRKIVLPLDVVVGKEDGEGARVVEMQHVGPGLVLPPGRDVASTARQQSSVRGRQGPALQICSKPYAILDIGPKTILEFAHYIKSAATLLWNGPMGFYEVKRFSHGTSALGRLFAARSRGKAFGVAGGGETIDALKQTGMMQDVDFVSTGGGAILQFMSGKPLPGITALTYAKGFGN